MSKRRPPPPLPVDRLGGAFETRVSGAGSTPVETEDFAQLLEVAHVLQPEDAARGLLRGLSQPLDEEDVATLALLISGLPTTARSFVGQLAATLDPRRPWTTPIEQAIQRVQQTLSQGLGVPVPGSSVIAAVVFPVAREAEYIRDTLVAIGERPPKRPVPPDDLNFARKLLLILGCPSTSKGRPESPASIRKKLGKQNYLRQKSQERRSLLRRELEAKQPELPDS